MKKQYQIMRMILPMIFLFTMSNIVLFGQDIKQDTTHAKIIELPQGCKLVLDTTIDVTDSLSIEIINGIHDVIQSVQTLIPLDSITIDLVINRNNVLPFLGFGGRTNMDDSGISIEYYYDPENPNFKTKYFINGLVHECHHASRMSRSNGKLTLLELMVREGLADHFMIEVTNCEQPQWSKALTEEEIKKYMIKSKPILFIKRDTWTQEFDEWLIFGRKGDDPIPGWTGYTLGWVIVENYLKAHPEALASSLVFTPAEEIAGSTPELMVTK
jgi:hypothetical protein